MLSFTKNNTIGNSTPRWSPDLISVAAWYDITDSSTVTKIGLAVSQWSDKSGNDYHMIQDSGAVQPVIDSRTIGGLSVLTFSGTESMSSTAGPLPGNNNSMVLAVCQPDSLARGRVYSTNNSYSSELLLDVYSDNAEYKHSGGGSGDIVTTPGVTSAQILGGYRDGSTVGVGINGGPYATQETGSEADDPTFWTIGSRNEISEYLDGTVGEVIVLLDYDLATRQKIEGYLAHKWGLAAELPSGHPYKVKAP